MRVKITHIGVRMYLVVAGCLNRVGHNGSKHLLYLLIVLFLFYSHSPGVYYAAVSFTWCPFKKLTLQLSDSITIIG